MRLPCECEVEELPKWHVRYLAGIWLHVSSPHDDAITLSRCPTQATEKVTPYMKQSLEALLEMLALSS